MGCFHSNDSFHKSKLYLSDLTNTEPLSFAYMGEAKVLKIIDGDTVKIAFPFNNKISHMNMRMKGIDAAELHSKNVEERKIAIEGKQFLERLILNKVIRVIIDEKLDKYGRPLVTIFIASHKIEELIGKLFQEEFNVNELMIEKRYAYRYDGGKKQVW